MLNCIFGAAGSGKTEYVYEKIRQNIKMGVKSFVLVPEQSSMDTERRLLKTLGFSSQLMAEVLTFSRISNLVFSVCGPLQLKYIDRAGKILVTKKTMQNLEKKLNYYSRNVHQRGFAQMAASLISELKRYGVSSEAVYKAAQTAEIEELSNKLLDIAMIYEEYDRLISDQYSDAEENLIKASEKIVKSNLFGGEIFLMGFKSFTPVEHLALAKLMEVADVTAVLVTDTLNETEGIFASAIGTWQKLKESAAALGYKVGECVHLDSEIKFKNNIELAHLKNNYFKYPPNIYKEETHNISLIWAKDSYDEMRKCARCITNLCRTENMRYRDFLILARDVSSYTAAAKAVFEEYGINCFINEKRRLSENPFVRKVLAAAEILAYGFSYERIMPVVKFGGEGYSESDSDVFENYILAANVSHKYWNDKEDWSFNPDEKRISMEKVNRVKRLAVNPIILMGESIKGRKTVGDICTALLKWIKSEKLDEAMESKVEKLKECGYQSVALEYTRSWNAFSSVISQMESCMGEDAATYEKFCEMLRSACDEVTISVTPPLADAVTFGEIDTFRKSNAKVVIAVGMIDGVFPKGYIEDGMLSDSEREVLADYGISLAPTAGFKRKEEQNLIYNVLTAPKEKLFLSVPLGDKEGKAVSPSEVVERICRLFPNISVEKYEDEEHPQVIFNNLLSALSQVLGDENKLSERDQIVYKYFLSQKEYKERLNEFSKSLRSYSPKEKLSKEGARLLYGDKLMVSVSKLEKYNACAFAYFMQYGLLAKERAKAGFEANNLGSILHETLQVYFEQLKRDNTDYGSVTKEMCQSQIEKIAKKSAMDSDSLLFENSPYFRYVTLRLTSVAAATAWEIVKFYASSSYRPYGFEVKIGGGGEFCAEPIDLGEVKAELTGFIDRVDTAEINGVKYVNIIDYKSSEKNTDEELERRGVQIQPLVYADIACKNLNAAPSGMMYIHMNEPMLKFDEEPESEVLEKERQKNVAIKGIVLNEEEVLLQMDSREACGEGYIPKGRGGGVSREQMRERVENAQKVVCETAAKIASGNIDINPCVTKKYDACRYCDFSKVCKESEN